MRKQGLMLLISMLAIATFAQEVQGIWISTHVLSILEKVEAPVDTTSRDIDSSPYDYEPVESIFENVYFLLDFKAKGALTTKGIGGQTKAGTYTVMADSIMLTVDSEQQTLLLKDNELWMESPDDERGKIRIVFERLLPSGKLKPKSFAKKFLKQGYWQLSIPNSPEYFKAELLLEGEDSLRVTKYYNEKRAKTAVVAFHQDSYQRHIFLAVVSEEGFGFDVFRFWMNKRGNYPGDMYEVDSFDETCVKLNLTLSPLSLPSEKTLGKTRSRLVGTWKGGKGTVPYDTILSGFDALRSEYYKLELKQNGQYKISLGATFTKEDRTNSRSRALVGTWELGKTGKYLILDADERRKRYLTIMSLSEDNLSFCLDTKSVASEMIYIGHFVALQKDR